MTLQAGFDAPRSHPARDKSPAYNQEKCCQNKSPHPLRWLRLAGDLNSHSSSATKRTMLPVVPDPRRNQRRPVNQPRRGAIFVKPQLDLLIILPLFGWSSLSSGSFGSRLIRKKGAEKVVRKQWTWTKWVVAGPWLKHGKKSVTLWVKLCFYIIRYMLISKKFVICINWV